MRVRYLSDLHLESQLFDTVVPAGDVLIIAGDLCHASCLDPERKDRYAETQRDRTLRFADAALSRFSRVLLVPGNHDHYDGVLEETAGLFRRFLPGVTVLDTEIVHIEGVAFFGATLWSDFEGRSDAAMRAVRRGLGDYFFIKTRDTGAGAPVKFRPEHALARHDAAFAALREAVASVDRPLVVVTHHAPSLQGLNPRFRGNGLDGAYASDLDGVIAASPRIRVWIHGHTHIARTYRIGDTTVRSNALGFLSKGERVPGFSAEASFEI